MILGSARAAGYDIHYTGPKITLSPGETQVLSTGLHIDVPGYWAKIEGRSGLASRGIFPIGGVIDEDYRGEIKVCIHNGSRDIVTFGPGDRIAQLVFHPTRHPYLPKMVIKDTRGVNGFGSTGV